MNSFLQSAASDSLIERSWQRSLDYGLRASGRIELRSLNAGQLNSRRQQYQQVLEQLRACAGLFERLQSGRQSRLIFAGRDGSILYSSGCRRFGRGMLEPGVGWEERIMGTNAIGTALFHQADVQVLGQQHFMQANHGISCSASPLFDPQGELLGVLDISSEARQHSPDMLLSARLLALCVENALVAGQSEACWLLHLAADNPYMQQPWSGLVALDESGRLVGANRIARQYLPELETRQLLDELEPGQLVRRGKGSVLLTRKLSTPVSVAMPEVPEQGQKENLPPVDGRALALLNAGISLLIQGETGVGKDHLVRLLHAHSNRQDGPLITVNCGALPPELVEAELFGYQAGAFTGSDRNGRLGYVRAANKGILFLDEIGELPLAAQTRLLRVLQDKSVTPVGSHIAEAVDFHVLAATNRDLSQMVVQGRFREDLYYRLNGYLLQLPPLREHDFVGFCALVERLLEQAPVTPAAGPDRPLLEQLFACRWPGNIRQLKQALEVAVVLAGGKPLALEHFPGLSQPGSGLHGQACPVASGDRCHETAPSVQQDVSFSGVQGQAGSPAPFAGSADTLKAKNREHALQVLEACGGNISAAARQLGISRTTLYSYLKR